MMVWIEPRTRVGIKGETILFYDVVTRHGASILPLELSFSTKSDAAAWASTRHQVFLTPRPAPPANPQSRK
jgi:hypothetical protein